MKGILEFNLPEDESDFKKAQQGGALMQVLWNVDRKLRDIVKYEDGLSSEVRGAYSNIRTFLHEEMREAGLEFE